jgi:hypothetical protein
MLEGAVQRIRGWFESFAQDDTHLSMGLAIKTGSAEPGINVHLLDVIGDPPARDNKPPPLQLTLSYLVTAWSDDGKPADDLLLKAAFAAMKDPSLEVILAPTAVELWRAFELAPRAAFLLRVPVRVAQVVPRAKPVTSTKFVTTQVRPVTGVVVDHLDRPLMDATVELIGLGRTAKDRSARPLRAR